MTTARDIISSALKKIHVLGVGTSLSAEDGADGLSTLNGMVSSWSAEGNLIPNLTTETFALSGATSYTMTTSFATTVPQRFITAYITRNGTDYPLDMTKPLSWYTSIADKDSTELPSTMIIEGGSTGKFYLYPVGLASDTITIISEKALTTFTTLDTVFNLPLEYQSALEFNLAVWRAPDYEREASPTVQRIAEDTKQIIVSKNTMNNPPLMEVDDALVSMSYSGWCR